MLVAALTTGMMFGLAAGFSPGPLSALVIAQTLRHNIREGMLVAVAPLLTDAPIILVTYFIIKLAADVRVIFGLISAAGGVYVVFLAIGTMRVTAIEITETSAPAYSLGKGALVNLLNPNPYLFWSTVGVPFVIKSQAAAPYAPWVFIAAFFGLLVSSKMAIAVMVGRFRTFLQGRWYRCLMRGLGLALAVFGLNLLREAAVYLGLLAAS